MDEVYLFPRNDYRSYLEHHGTPGQKWGVRRAAWYPIAAFQKASNKVGTKVHEFREKRAAERKRKQRAANLQKAREARAKKAQEQKDFETEKKRILTSGTPGEVVKISSKLTSQEIQDALNRNRNLEQLRAAESTRIKDIKEAEFAKKYEQLDKIAKTVNKGIEYANTAKNAIDVYKGIKKLLKDDGPETSDIDAILKNPKNYTDEQVKNAAARYSNLKRMGYGQQQNSSDSDGGKKPSESKPDTKQKEPETYTQTINADPNAKQSRNNYEQTGSKKSNVIDGDWSEVITPDNVAKAASTISKAMNSFDNMKDSPTMKLLEQKNIAQPIFERGADVDDKKKR